MIPTPPYSAILWDLDGTIVDSAPGITSSLEQTFADLGLPMPMPESMMRWVGPPILDAFRDFAGFDERMSALALRVYRRHYLKAGVYDAHVYPGIPEVLAALAATGVPMSLATSKPERTAKLVLDHFDLTPRFAYLTGASEDETRSKKSDVVLEALRRLRAGGADLSNPVMIGDRHHDVEGSADRGVPCLYVTWGYGEPGEEAGAIGVAETPEQLLALLGLAV